VAWADGDEDIVTTHDPGMGEACPRQFGEGVASAVLVPHCEVGDLTHAAAGPPKRIDLRPEPLVAREPRVRRVRHDAHHGGDVAADLAHERGHLRERLEQPDPRAARTAGNVPLLDKHVVDEAVRRLQVVHRDGSPDEDARVVQGEHPHPLEQCHLLGQPCIGHQHESSPPCSESGVSFSPGLTGFAPRAPHSPTLRHPLVQANLRHGAGAGRSRSSVWSPRVSPVV